MSGKYALIIGDTEYADPGLAQLTAPGKDAEDFARVLKDQNLCAFDSVNLLLNQPEYLVRGAIDEFFDQKKPDDLLVLYFSGHGVRDDLGALYLAVKNTIRTRLRSTAIKSDYIREAMDQSRSKRQVLILDCCNSGAFQQGTKAATGVSIGTASAFEVGYGRIILTASDSTQFAWEGDKVIGETDNSLFTHYLVQGLEGEADLDGDGTITVDELYDYAYDKVKFATPKQTPSKFSSKQQGEIVLRRIKRIEDIKPISLPDELIEATEDSRTFVREGAVQQLEKFLRGKNLGLARSARELLERMEREDDSRRVSQAATKILEPIRQAEKVEEERKAREEAERIAAQKAEEERLALERAEAEQLLAEQKAEEERKTKEEAERKAKEELKAREEAERKAQEEAERLLAEQKAKEERLAREKAEAEQRAKEEAERLLAEQKAEEQRRAREEAERLASLRAEEECLAREKAARVASAEQSRALSSSSKKFLGPARKYALVGLMGVMAIVLAAIFIPKLNLQPLSVPTVAATNTLTTGASAATLSPSVTTSDSPPLEIKDSKGVTMRLVPAGEFIMGSNDGDSDEQPVHKVNLSGFYMDKYEVTNSFYKACVKASVCAPPQNTSSATRASYYDSSVFDNYPVINVNWDMGNTYCKWRGAELPSEAQWEKAARGTDARTYPWGEGIDCNKANYSNRNKFCVGDTSATGSYGSGQSPYGIYDMAGNVWEWMADRYSDTYYQTLYDGVLDPTGPDQGLFRVLRGGSWLNVDSYARSASRFKYSGSGSDNYIGFRCSYLLP